MKRCINCFNEYNETEKSCPECGFNGKAKNISLNGRYSVGGVQTKAASFVVYYAFDNETQQRVRVYEYLPQKLMYRSGGTIKFRSEEARTTAEKEIAAFHSHFVKLCEISRESVLDITDCFTENSTVYYVCGSAAGTPLSSLMGNGRMMTFSRAVKLLAPVIECAEKLEKAGKWHGSLSSYNIITNENKITAVTGYSYPPKIGHSPFDAPEKQLGAKKCGSFTDVYSIGAMLYESVTGVLPPSAEQRNQGKALSLPDTLSEKEKNIIEKALAADITERYTSVGALCEDIGLNKPAETKKKIGTGEIIRRTVLTVSVITLVCSLVFLLNYYVIEPLVSDKQTGELASMVETTIPGIDPWDAIREQYPDVDFPEGMDPSLAKLYAENNDLAGRIRVPGMNIDFPVVQTADNDYYLRRDFYKNSTNYGVPFFDCNNTLRQLDRNTVIYGHNMKSDDKIFGPLEEYRDIETFKKAPIITVNTLYGEYTFKIYAVFISNSKKSDDNGRFFNYIFTAAGDSQFMDYIAEVDKRKLYTTGVDVIPTDKIVTLSTCCYDFKDARLVVVGRLLRSGESAQVDTSLPVINENPKFPQAYYDKKGIDNPYKDDVNLF